MGIHFSGRFLSGTPRHRISNSLLNSVQALAGSADNSDAAVTHWQNDALNIVIAKRLRARYLFLGHQQDSHRATFALYNQVRHYAAINGATLRIGDQTGIVIQG